ncbi:MAG TPA: beta-N-acetylhexosaminidase, partial [Clostridiales bacterium]|nr:beta-N-acetylhexosaminidase [Clostridiales bacterium]
MKLHFTSLPEELREGLTAIAPKLKIELSADGLPVEANYGSGISVSQENGKANLVFEKKHLFFRALSLLVQHGGKDFSIRETPAFETVSVMIDASRNAVMTVEAIQDFTGFLALMGYNMIMMYTEETYEIPGRPYFGYMRGRYTYEELKACDDYADMLGIEMIPCVQAMGHMAQYLRWGEAGSVKDTPQVLLAGSEKTYEFIEQMMKAASAPFRSKRIHIGMDEAWDLGLGQYLKKNGFTPTFKIFIDHLNRVMNIVDKLGLRAMMWCDMFFRVCSSSGLAFYDPNIVISDEDKEKIPAHVELVYWHYGESKGCDDYMLDKCKEMNRPIIFAGGLWTWQGHYPELHYAVENTELAVKACKAKGVKEFMMTIWGNDGHECDPFAPLLGLQYTAEMCYRDGYSDEEVKARFEACTGASFEAFWDMTQYQNRFQEGVEYKTFGERFMGKKVLWNDPMEGLLDKRLFDNPLSDHYEQYAKRLKAYIHSGDRWQNLYQQAYQMFSLLALKTFLAERLVPAYVHGNKEFLRE